jgi:hypothetical protein
MPTTTFDRTDQWKALAFDAIQFTFATSSTIFVIKKLAKGSTFILSPVFSKFKDNSGNDKTVAYKFTAQANVSQSNIADFNTLIGLFASDKVISVILTLGDLMLVNTSMASLVKSILVNWKVVYVDAYIGPELQLNVSCSFGADVSSNVNILFNQLW